MFVNWRQVYAKIHLRQPGFTYSACGAIIKHCKRIKKLKETGDLKYIYENELGKSRFAHDAAYADSKDLIQRTVSDKVLKDRAYESALYLKYGYQKGLVIMVYKLYKVKKQM